jgi:anaerobic magnesium-protoporphyrin IX monomethyl ester cyclase
MKKRQTVQQIKEKISLINKNTKIRLTGYFLIGYPEEETEDILKTIKLAKELNLKRAQFAICLPLPGSEIYKELKEKNIINEINYDSIRLHNICYEPYKIPSWKLNFLRLYAYLTFYTRPKILFGILREIKSFQHLKFILRKIKMLFNFKRK